MAYNPYHLVPPDNPRAEWCKFCTEQVFPENDDSWQTIKGDWVHFDCLGGYVDGLLLEIEALYKEKEKLISMDLS